MLGTDNQAMFVVYIGVEGMYILSYVEIVIIELRVKSRNLHTATDVLL